MTPLETEDPVGRGDRVYQTREWVQWEGREEQRGWRSIDGHPEVSAACAGQMSQTGAQRLEIGALSWVELRGQWS